MPRDINRIYPFCNQLAALWSQHPDLRFGQIIEMARNHAINKCYRDIFYMEDEQVMKIFEIYLKEKKK